MFSEKHFARLVQRTLLAGVVLCLLLFFFGFVLRVLESPVAAGFFTAGVLALLLTPAARVLMLIYGFCRMRELFMALSAFAVLALLLVAFIL
ncbi:MAG: hypothetical protein A2X34_05750 [Elusimicrobia bacterium GWC2_51_8]|nr:MAG: hypothetical protein A2X33_09525 [Elusimicrobia bacterium GWA2_51_34]OGR58453.1 MAG: hypothetical protein A2X34_05750 [Elusimicrobia bacterium GWC2_51_8]HAF94580.1 hypothetical protein [Elusimicrobiota bacterium]HCE98086.1 hypothetical protein [Elusimicrobiota bacterium]